MLAHPRLGNKLDRSCRDREPEPAYRGAALYSAWPRMSQHSRTTRETEIKLRIADPPALIRDLKRLGATQRGRVLERNTLYDTPESDFRSRGRLLRLRVEIPAPSKFAPAGARRAILTAKAPVPESGRSRYKQRLEREVAVESPGRWPSALRSIGLRPRFRYEKYRTTFRLPGLYLELDETPVGVFLELEGPPRIIDRVARTLGFGPREYINATYWDLYAADCRRRGRRPTNMLLSR
jgi:adenylate cyclase, class 2